MYESLLLPTKTWLTKWKKVPSVRIFFFGFKLFRSIYHRFGLGVPIFHFS